MLQCGAVWYSVVQCVAECCSVLHQTLQPESCHTYVCVHACMYVRVSVRAFILCVHLFYARFCVCVHVWIKNAGAFWCSVAKTV